jgi:PAS domain S-box-containing protein
MLGVREEDVVGMLGCDFAATEEDAELLRQSMLCPQKTPTDLEMRDSSGQAIAVTAYPSDEKRDALQVTFLPRETRREWPTEDLPGILVATMDGRIALVNDRLAGLYGMPREQFQGRMVWELVVPEVQIEAKKRILSGATGPIRWPVVTADGRRTIVDAVTTIEILNGQPMRVTRGWEVAAGGTVDDGRATRPDVPQPHQSDHKPI